MPHVIYNCLCFLRMSYQLYRTVSPRTCACGACCGFQHLGGHKVDLGIVCGLDTAFDPQHLTNSVLISMTDLKFFPGLPEISSHLKEYK